MGALRAPSSPETLKWQQRTLVGRPQGEGCGREHEKDVCTGDEHGVEGGTAHKVPGVLGCCSTMDLGQAPLGFPF